MMQTVSPENFDSANDVAGPQSLTHYRLRGNFYPRLPYGTETFRAPTEAARQPCRHCDALRGQLHEPLCDYEQCPVCGGQVMSCDCDLFVEDAVDLEG